MRQFLIPLLAAVASSGALAVEPVQYSRDVRSILAKNCFACHGFDGGTREADLRLDQREAAIDVGAFVPGKADKSEIIIRIESEDPDLLMPPADTGHALMQDEIKLLRRWVDEGAEYDQHWSFVPPSKSKLPPTSREGWARVPLDHFVLAKLEASGMEPSPDADRARWLRRVSLDLTGLPPTLEQADALIADKSDDVFEKVVDRLLQSDAYGEHWARMWLDLARYADTKGYEKDRHRDIWRYRDWVIDALNRDMPYDQFTTEQLAGDLLPDRTTDQILATAFHRNTMTNEEGGTDNEEFRVAAVKDRVDTTIQVWMGLTMGCSKCHSHKYDPISNKDYYQFYAFFNQTQDADNEAPLWPTPTNEQSKRIAKLESDVVELKKHSRQRPDTFANAFAKWKEQFDAQPLWQTLSLAEFASEKNVQLTQNDQGNIIASGERPDRDQWTLTFDLPGTADGRKFTAFRIDHFPQAMGGGDWPDTNVAIRELSAELVDPNGRTQSLKLKNPRATFSQAGWKIEQAIDGKENAGWALSPKFNEQQAGIFEFSEPVAGGQLKITLEQKYGESQLLGRSRFSISAYPTNWLRAELEPDLEQTFASEVFKETMEVFRKLALAQQQLLEAKTAIPKTPVMLELDEKKQRKTKIHNRGNFLNQGDEVTPSVLSVFGPFPDGAPENRLGVAKWLMSAENPLTSRVMVNRIWARLFGVGIVETEEDFGTQGLLPSHPQLLDWLAVDFRENGWSIKQLLRSIVLSSTYRQSSSASAEQIAGDPRNRLLSRGPRFRLPAETVRDQALAVSGLLTRKIGGPSVMPPQPGGVWKTTYSGDDWKNAVGPNRFRRGLYTYLKRTSPYPAMTTFDAGSGEVCQIRRVRTNTPLQALVTMNDTAFVEAAGALANRMKNASGDLQKQIAAGFRMVLVRPADSIELERLVELYRTLEFESADGTALLQAAGLSEGDPKLVAVANVLLNLDETLMKP